MRSTRSSVSDTTDSFEHQQIQVIHHRPGLQHRNHDIGAPNRLGRRGRKGAPDTFDPGGYAALLRRLRSSPEETVYAPAFDRDIEQPIAGSIPVHPRCRLVVTEGNYLLLDDPAWRAARAELDAVWFVEAGEALRLERLVARHVEFGKTPAPLPSPTSRPRRADSSRR